MQYLTKTIFPSAIEVQIRYKNRVGMTRTFTDVNMDWLCGIWLTDIFQVAPTKVR